MKIAVIINAKNEEDFIADCLESVKWADETVVLLSKDSTDKTEKIARGFGTKIIEQESKEMNYAAWRDQGLKEARSDWLLWIDADERVSPLLRREIETVITNRQIPFTTYAIPRRNFLLGKELHFGGWYPDFVERLFLRNKLKKWEGKLHERPVYEGQLGYLANPLIHLQPEKIEPALQKSINWSDIEAKLLFDSSHPPVTWWRVLRMGATTLFERLIKKQGFRDGTEGWIESIYQAFHTMVVYLRLWEKQNEK